MLKRNFNKNQIQIVTWCKRTSLFCVERYRYGYDLVFVLALLTHKLSVYFSISFSIPMCSFYAVFYKMSIFCAQLGIPINISSKLCSDIECRFCCWFYFWCIPTKRNTHTFSILVAFCMNCKIHTHTQTSPHFFLFFSLHRFFKHNVCHVMFNADLRICFQPFYFIPFSFPSSYVCSLFHSDNIEI